MKGSLVAGADSAAASAALAEGTLAEGAVGGVPSASFRGHARAGRRPGGSMPTLHERRAPALHPAPNVTVRTAPRPRHWMLGAGLLVVAASVYALIHLATITTARLPWFDDTFFASVTDSLLHTGQFKLTISPLWFDKPVYLYGPVYFLVMGGVFHLFDIGVAQTRVPGLLFGFGIVAISYVILRRGRVGTRLALVICALMALDPTFHQDIHSGRMDSTAMFFILSSFYLLMRAGEEEGRAAAYSCLGSAALASLAALTTPRPGYLLFPMAAILLVRWCRRPDRERALNVLLWGSVCLFFFTIWIAYAFGSISALLTYYSSFSDAYANGGFGVRAIHAPLLIPLFLILAAALILKPHIFLYDVAFFTITGILGFYTFVKDKGAFSGLYSFFMTPLAYLALGYALSWLAEARRSTRAMRWLEYATLGGLLLFNGSIFAARTTLEALQHQARSPVLAESVIQGVIPPGSRVVGDDKYYFAVRKAGSDFQYMQRGGSLEDRVTYQANAYDFQYLVTSDSDTAEVLDAYLKQVPLVPVATITTPPDGALARFLTALAQRAGLGSSLTSSYEGRIFARATPNAPTP